MVKAVQKPHNKLFNRLYREILNIEDGSYICLSNDLWAKGKSQEQIEDAIYRQISGATSRTIPIFHQPAAPLRKGWHRVHWTAAGGKDHQSRARRTHIRV